MEDTEHRALSGFTSISRGVLLGLGEFPAAAFFAGYSGTVGLAGSIEACPRGSSAARSLAYLHPHNMKEIKDKTRSILVVLCREQSAFAG